MLKKLRGSYIAPALRGVRRLASAGIICFQNGISALTHGCQAFHSLDQDIEFGLSMQSSGEPQVLELNIPVLSTSISYARSIKWLIETSSDPDVFLAAVSQVPDSDGLLSLREMSDLNLQLQETFMSCFDDHNQCITGADDKAVACGLALGHMFWRRYLLPYEDSMLLPGESKAYFPHLRPWSTGWWRFRRCWAHLECKDPKFLLATLAGIRWRISPFDLIKDPDILPYPTNFIIPLLQSLSYAVTFLDKDWTRPQVEELAIRFLSRLLPNSSPAPSTQLIANCTALVLCVLGLHFTDTDLMNINKRYCHYTNFPHFHQWPIVQHGC